VLVAVAGLALLTATLLAGAAGAQTDPPEPAPETPTTAPVSRTTLTARLFDDSNDRQEPVAGVRVIVSRGGEVVGEATSDEEGVALIPLSEGGTYEVRLDKKTYPKGVAPPPEERLPSVEVQEGRPKFVIFPFGQTEASEPSAVDRLADLFASGIRVGLVVAIAAVGLSLVFSTTGLINFATGELVTFGAIAAWFLNAEGSDGLGLTLVAAGVIAVLLGGLFGAALDAGLWKPLRRRRTGNVALIVVSIGLALVLRSVFQIIFGAAPKSYAQYATQQNLDLGPLDLAAKDIASIVISVAILVGVACFLLFTRLGTAIRAVSDEPDLAESSGIDVQRVIRTAWIMCGALSAAAGVLLAVTLTVEYDLGFKFLLVIFAAMIVGGLGSPWGAMLGGVLLGIVFDVSTYWIATDFKTAMILGVLIVVLLVRPQGILGSRERVG
jgi:branched-chain amino acid transport system permease protein